ncbi:hypothetical protein GKD08_17725 [Paeniclostridium sordellii]|uniref:hypothetical protein n=1 Tax=Paraclostridium sordellii TaxID=1505 RepID=UPI0012AF437C|nr:hypothetical protein [Paeniclostridium sordellii]MRZ30575.1 hypothetical protein [Paeniclostridium sordellii]
MAYLLKIEQFERSYDIGGFESEESIYKFIESIPFVKKEIISNDYITYFIKFEDIPDYYELNYNNYTYVFSKNLFIPSKDEIYFSWSKIHFCDEKVVMKETFTEEKKIIDSYYLPNNEVKNYIVKGEEIYKESKKIYKNKELEDSREFIEYQSGEYIELLNGSMIYVLDSRVIDTWIKSKSIEEFIDNYKIKTKNF